MRVSYFNSQFYSIIIDAPRDYIVIFPYQSIMTKYFSKSKWVKLFSWKLFLHSCLETGWKEQQINNTSAGQEEVLTY